MCPRRLPAESGEWKPGRDLAGGKPGPFSRYPKLWVFVDVNTVIFQDICEES